eukprot:CAMPEP_0177665268 /NCGR_PEP_ID=MMETSP0447-20121125/20962_1 /TAXON_ID=0 /ORGANISM="Stygamoeba regulata, Strain BSH-02190019" /LENGTH=290 /DNA_ID=CAMNT_0019171347 /DNA_START=77 /DNA_END=949 /DNA_ORIENTATION=-
MSSSTEAETKQEYTYKYNMVDGVVFPPHITQEQFDLSKSFATQPTDVFIATYPKSGTTWTQQICRKLTNCGHSAEDTLTQAIPWLEVDVAVADALPGRRFMKSHTSWEMIRKGEGVKYIYVARNPRDTLVSMFHHSRGFMAFEYDGPFEHFFELFLSGQVESGPWADHVLSYWKESLTNSNVLYLFYEEMLDDPAAAVRSIADFIGVDASEETVKSVVENSSFTAMKSDPRSNYSWADSRRHQDRPGFFRKGKAGDWTNHMSDEMVKRFSELIEEPLRAQGFPLERTMRA